MVLIIAALAVAAWKQAKRANRNAQQEAAAARAAAQADEARIRTEDLISFMLGELREKLSPINRLDLLDDVLTKVLKNYRGFYVSTAEPARFALPRHCRANAG